MRGVLVAGVGFSGDAGGDDEISISSEGTEKRGDERGSMQSIYTWSSSVVHSNAEVGAGG